LLLSRKKSMGRGNRKEYGHRPARCRDRRLQKGDSADKGDNVIPGKHCWKGGHNVYQGQKRKNKKKILLIQGRKEKKKGA